MGQAAYPLIVAFMIPWVVIGQEIGKTEIRTGSWKGVVVEETCFRKLGVAGVIAADHAACAMECVQKDNALGLLTDDDGYMRIVGEMSKNRYAPLIQFVGKRVNATGESFVPTGNYSTRQIAITKILLDGQ
jgi:hypothetical protein